MLRWQSSGDARFEATQGQLNSPVLHRPQNHSIWPNEVEMYIGIAELFRIISLTIPVVNRPPLLWMISIVVPRLFLYCCYVVVEEPNLRIVLLCTCTIRCNKSNSDSDSKDVQQTTLGHLWRPLFITVNNQHAMFSATAPDCSWGDTVLCWAVLYCINCVFVPSQISTDG